jgi:hypothetical protein
MFLIHHHYGLRKKYLSFLFNILKKFIKSGKIKNKMIELKINSKNIYSLSLFLKKHTKCLYKILTDIVVYDCPGKKFRFTVLYNLLSISYNSRIIISTKLIEKLSVLKGNKKLLGGSAIGKLTTTSSNEDRFSSDCITYLKQLGVWKEDERGPKYVYTRMLKYTDDLTPSDLITLGLPDDFNELSTTNQA